jgi:hypothetical protein
VPGTRDVAPASRRPDGRAPPASALTNSCYARGMIELTEGGTPSGQPARRQRYENDAARTSCATFSSSTTNLWYSLPRNGPIEMVLLR